MNKKLGLGILSLFSLCGLAQTPADSVQVQQLNAAVVASSGLTFIPINDFQVSWVSKYVGARYLTNENESNAKLDAFWVNNLNLSYELRPANFCKSITFALDVNNFLNNKYYSHGRYKKGKAYYFPQATANVMAGVTFHF